MTVTRSRLRSVLAFPLLATLAVATLIACACAPSAAPKPGAGSTPTSTPAATSTPTPSLTFAIIGAYASGNEHEQAVADMVASWAPDFIVTTGDNYQKTLGGKGAEKYDISTGRYYGAWLPGTGSTKNAFFPSLGNHDYNDAGLETYLDYFELPGKDFTNTSGKENYYDFTWGPVRVFVLDSFAPRNDANAVKSEQATWLRDQLAASKATWNLVVFHHPPFSSDEKHYTSKWMQWPFATWGADAVVAGHAQTYERIERDGIPYFVNGLGGEDSYGFVDKEDAVEGSEVAYRGDWGAQKVTVTEDALVFEFYNTGGTLVDRRVLEKAK